jgi:hypothetical protein
MSEHADDDNPMSLLTELGSVLLVCSTKMSPLTGLGFVEASSLRLDFGAQCRHYNSRIRTPP